MTTASLEELRRVNYEIAETIAPGWERRRADIEEVARPLGEWMIARLDPRPGDTVLELAAGAGDTGFAAAERLGEDGLLISSDFVQAMLDVARRRGEEIGVRNVEYRLIDAQAIDLGDDSVDGVLCRLGYMLMPDRRAAMAETRRVLRPGGRLALTVFGPPERNPFFAIAAMALVEGGHIPPPDPDGPGIFSMASPERIGTLLDEAGFERIEIEELPLSFSFESVDEYLGLLADSAGPLAMAMRGLGEAEREDVRERVEIACRGFARDGGLEFPGLGLAAVATA